MDTPSLEASLILRPSEQLLHREDSSLSGDRSPVPPSRTNPGSPVFPLAPADMAGVARAQSDGTGQAVDNSPVREATARSGTLGDSAVAADAASSPPTEHSPFGSMHQSFNSTVRSHRGAMATPLAPIETRPVFRTASHQMLGGSPVPQGSMDDSGRRSPNGAGRPLLTHGDVAELHEAFRMLSETGGLTADGLLKLLRTMGHHTTEEDIADLVRGADQSGSGSITFPDFVCLLGRRVEDRAIEEMVTAFHHYDKKNSGFVSAVQFCEIFATMGEKSTPDEIDEMLLSADPHSSGRIDYMMWLRKLQKQTGR